MAHKKSFKEDINPAMRFISSPTQEDLKTKDTGTAQKGYKQNPLYIETKSRRLQLLLQPSLYEKIKTQAHHESKSINEFIHIILEYAMKDEKLP